MTRRIVNEKIPMTPSGIEAATFQLVAQFFNQMCHRVPQSIMVTLIFFIYINDLPNVTIHTNLSDNPKTILFADYTSVIVNNSNFTDFEEVINMVLKNVNKLFSSHLLSLNFGKTYFMKFITKIALVM